MHLLVVLIVCKLIDVLLYSGVFMKLNYKIFFPKREIRIFILGLLDFIPDSTMIKIQYYLSQERFLNIKSPRRFTEKIQWYKLNYRDELMTRCADKIELKDYVKARVGECYVVPNYAVFDTVDDIDFSILPDKFVLKTSNGSHTNIICHSKSDLNIEDTTSKLRTWLECRSVKLGREWSYYNIKPRILCEELLPFDKQGELIDYKFFCFNGKVEFLYVLVDRNNNSGLKLAILDSNFNKLEAYRNDIQPLVTPVDKPENYSDMIKIAKELSKDFPHVRVDLYNLDGQIYVGELTFYDGSGYKGFIPDDFDYKIGELFHLPNENN